MSKTSDTIDNPQRRRLLASATAALAGGAVIATAAHAAPVATPGGAGDDAEILRLHRDLLAQNAIVAAWNAGTVDAKTGMAAQSRFFVCLHAMCRISAVTQAGTQAKAEALRLAIVDAAYAYEGETVEEIAEHGDPSHRIALSLARDVLAGRAAA